MIIISGVSFQHILVILYAKIFRKKLVVFYFDLIHSFNPVMYKVIEFFDFEFKKVPSLGINSTHTDAIKYADSIIEKGGYHEVISKIEKQYNIDDFSLYFKKIVAKQLVEVFHIDSYLSSYEGSNMIFSNTYKYSANLLRLYSSYSHHVSFRFTYSFLSIKFKVLLAMIFFSSIVVFLIKKYFIRKSCTVENEKIYDYAILISDYRNMEANSAKRYDFFLKYKPFNKSNTVFIVDAANLSNDTLNLTNNNIVYKPTKKELLKAYFLNYKLIPTISLFYTLLVAKHAINLDVLKLVYFCEIDKIYWEKCKFRNYIYNNRESENQIAENILLHSHNVVTWNYMMFIGGEYKNNSSGLDPKRVLWSFINCKNFVLNNDGMLQSMQYSNQKVHNYHAVGNISSQIIYDTKKRGHHKKNDQFVVSVFDTSYINAENIYSSYKECICFLSDIIALANRYSDIKFYFKPSKHVDYFTNTRFQWSEPSEGKEVVDLRSQLSLINNVTVLDHIEDSLTTICYSDLVVTDCFSSPTADALSLGINAFWYDAISNVRKFPFDNIGKLVLHGRRELLDNFHNYFDGDYLDDIREKQEFKLLIDPYSDNQALTRFTQLISGE